MNRPIEEFFLRKEEPIKSCLLALRTIILQYDHNIAETWKYNLPFYTYLGKMCCYLWIEKKTAQPYIGFVDGRKMDHPDLIAGTRSRMKIFLVDPAADIDIDNLRQILRMMTALYKRP